MLSFSKITASLHIYALLNIKNFISRFYFTHVSDWAWLGSGKTRQVCTCTLTGIIWNGHKPCHTCGGRFFCSAQGLADFAKKCSESDNLHQGLDHLDQIGSCQQQSILQPLDANPPVHLTDQSPSPTAACP